MIPEMNWIKFVNKNSKFFRTQWVIRRRQNKITGVFIDGIWCTDSLLLRNDANNFFKQLFQISDTCFPSSLVFQDIPKIST